MLADPFQYRAFISYSHSDTVWAKWLHRDLEGFRIDKDLIGRRTSRGTIPDALRPIFRDRDDFTAGHTLTEQTLAALDASAALIVVCSPSAATSPYVNEEVRLFKSRHPERPVIPLIVAGKPGDPELECFAPALKFKVDTKGRVTKKPVEMLAADAREESDGKDLALAKMIAGLLGLSSDEVFRRAERERRAAARRRRRVQMLFSALALVLMLGGAAWINQDYLKEKYYWHAVMTPKLLTAAQESTLKRGSEFMECRNGCPAMVVVPAGKFLMGSPKGFGQDRERPQHEVTIAKPFAISKLEVSFAEWDMCVAAGGCLPVGDSSYGRGEQPVINVSKDEADRYVAWLSRLTGRLYRLLSEAEWEYAARAGSTTRYPRGNEEVDLINYGWHWGTSLGRPQPVGQLEPNNFGLYDMHGNVWEWVQDCWHDSYKGAPSDGTVWMAEDCEKVGYLLRGGSWGDSIASLTSANRGRTAGSRRSETIGFRVARTLIGTSADR